MLRLNNTPRRRGGARFLSIIVAALALWGAVWSGTARAEPVECFVYDDNFTNMVGPADAIYFAGPSKACISDGTALGACRKWFGKCRTTITREPVWLGVHDDGRANLSEGSWSVYMRDSNSACIPDGTASGTCRRWFTFAKNEQGKSTVCHAFNDGYTSVTKERSGVFYFRNPGQVCMPDKTAYGTCRKWFGRCETIN